MGRCLSIGGKPPEINISLPGGIKIMSMSSGTQQIPNIMDPFQSLLQGVQPALGAIQPIFDIIGFIMQLLQCWIGVMRIFAALAVPVLGPVPPTNPIIGLFPPPPVIDPDTNEPKDPYEPDLIALFTNFMDCVMGLMGRGLKMAGLVPQISMAVTIKDSVLTAMGFFDAAMAQVNSLTDLFTGIPAANTGLPEIDLILQCTADNSSTQLEHKLGPMGNLASLMAVVSLLANVARQPLPTVVLDMAKLMANPPDEGGFGVIPFVELPGGPTAEDQRQEFLDVIEEMTISGLPIEAPDLSDMSSVGDKLNELQEKLEPILPVIEMLQSVFNKLTEA